MQPVNPATLVEDIQADPAPRKEWSKATAVADVASSLNNKYFTLGSQAFGAHYVWFNVGGAGVDPAPGGTGIVVAFAANSSANVVATAIEAALNVDAHWSASLIGDPATSADIQIIDSVGGFDADIGAGNSGFAVSVLRQGQDRGDFGSLASDSPGNIDNNPGDY